ncbi:Copine_I [Hexamita inflata]|uniref:Copine I n=1 Tax=Hexamita inflata TaxID=28002 RepID=A0AA86R5A0_9EUKA|nr:Copine I [Hexamita inflata]
MGSANTYKHLEQTMEKLNYDAIECTFFFSFSRTMEPVIKEGDKKIKKILECLAKVQHIVDKDQQYPVYRFGCSETRDKSVLPMNGSNSEPFIVKGVENIVSEVTQAAKEITFAGPTSLTPMIEQMIKQAKENIRKYQLDKTFKIPHQIAITILNNETSTRISDHEHLKQAAEYPISFVILSPQYFEIYNTFDHAQNVKFDSFRYTSISKVLQDMKAKDFGESEEVAIVNDMFKEISAQHVNMQRLQMIE